MRLLSAVLLSSLLLTGCGSGSGESATNNNRDNNTTPVTPPVPDPDLKPDVPPTPEGNWYKPTPSTTWQWQLTGTVNTSYNVDVYDIDLFDSSEDLIAQLQQSGKKVICYFSAGSYENWRSDANKFNESDLGNNLDGWPGERWLDIRSANVLSIMKDRMTLAKQKGCDAVELDNVDGYSNNTGFNLTNSDQLAFNRAVANYAHSLNLSIGLKNDLEQVLELVDYFDFAINESCTDYNECHLLKPFIDAGKAVFNAEYQQKYVNDASARDAMCQQSKQMQFSTLVLPEDLNDSFRYSCL
ncbi:endo alpha-1,4 polygalactosaminidase [Photobacterium jeanii]|uniref:Endo alpha-1,4 polygalactosaminidase n=1 Tax=Photobacterium jeanii TaxID=858640 RepID=A0A178K1L7_9GAMM|nr:endo alpha-1,4 polygalactosaminidase [Photobacterium jeanii]OAN10845.1 endo alpha-1,4 polygalactosaminidase [Photobacterium jeanii]PST90361.1 endo alpha-1,4 polygalactosaminidase [Photobacterium jeanii]